ncbi:hypothetical protein ACEPAF_9046 [Sanghuangporus sanghuang]
MKPENRTFIISGGSSGLGLATAYALLEAGAFVSVFDIQENSDLFSKSDTHVKFFKTDVSNESDVSDAVEGTIAWTQSTGAQLGGIIAAAGISPFCRTIDDEGNPHPLEDWNRVIGVNLTGAFNLTRLACKYLTKVPPEGPDGERGSIVLVSSVAATEGTVGFVAYSASKGGILSATLALARDLAQYGIRVNCIAPGPFTSGMTDSLPDKARECFNRELFFPNRFGIGHEFAQAVKFLIECGYANGATIDLTGATRVPTRLDP